MEEEVFLCHYFSFYPVICIYAAIRVNLSSCYIFIKISKYIKIYHNNAILFYDILTWPDSTTPVSYSVARRSRKIPPPFHPRLYDCSGAEHGREIWPVGINKTWDKDNDYISQQSHCQSARLLKSPAVRVTHFSQLTCGYSRVSTMAAIVARLTRRRRQREALSAEYDYETSKVERREDF